MEISIDNLNLQGELIVPKAAIGLVIFAHGSGSSRHSPRNQFVADKLNEAKLATLLFDLLTEKEEEIDIETAKLRFNIELLADRLIKVTKVIQNSPKVKNLNIGYFGSSTGAAAALIAASKSQKLIKAVVSRGGRPDLAKNYLKDVKSATLLIVGGNDLPVITMNEEALNSLTCIKEMTIVPNATHLFEEKGKLEEVAILARNWFSKHLRT